MHQKVSEAIDHCSASIESVGTALGDTSLDVDMPLKHQHEVSS